MHTSGLLALALASTAWAFPNVKHYKRFSNGTEPAEPTVITTEFTYLCPTGPVKQETTVTTDLPPPPSGSASYDIIPGWTTTVCKCSACSDKETEYTLTLPPGVAPENPTGTEPVTTGPTDVPATTTPGPDATGSNPEEPEVTPTTIVTSIEYICPTGIKTIDTTIETELPVVSTTADNQPPPGWVVTETVCDVCEDKTETHTFTLPPGCAPTGDNDAPDVTGPTDVVPTPSATAPVESSPPAEVTPTKIVTSIEYICPTGIKTIDTTIETELPVVSTTADNQPPPGWIVTETVCDVCEDKSETHTFTLPPGCAPTGDNEGPEVTGPTDVDVTPTATATEDVPSTTAAEVTPTKIVTSIEYICPTGIKTIETTIETELPVVSTTADNQPPPGWTVTETVCDVCEDKSETHTFTLPPGCAPTGGNEGPEVTGPTDVVVTPTETSTAPEETEPVTTDVPVVEVPTPTGGEDVITTVIKTEYTAICPTGLTKTSTEITKTIPATATESSYSFSMTKTETVCTVCGPEPSTVTLEVPAVTPSVSTPPPQQTETLPATEPVTTEIPSVSVPVPTEGEPAITTVITNTYETIGTTGVETLTVPITKTVPASCSGSTFAVTMTTVKTVCTVCGSKPTTVALTVPANYETTVVQPQPPVATYTDESTTVVVQEPTPVPDTPHQVVETVIYNPEQPKPPMSTSVATVTYTSVGSTGGLDVVTTPYTMEVPASATTTPKVEYDTTTAVCEKCGAGGTESTVTLTIPKNTLTVTVTPTSLITIPVGTASTGRLPVPTNGTHPYYTPSIASASATLPPQADGAARVGVSGVLVAGVVAFVALF